MPKSKFSAFVSLMLVFVSGAVVGAFAHRLYLVNSVNSVVTKQQTRPTPEEFRRRQIEDVKQKVHLDDQQVAQYNAILDETHQQFDQIHDKLQAEGRRIHDQQVEKVRAMLKPDQLPLYDKWRAERDAEHKRREAERNAKK
jgi:hypothetical protein